MEQEIKLFTREELKCRNTREDAILIIHNGVYDVTKFLEEHPGGEEVLLERAGQDGTDPFEDVSHSSDARSLMQQYKIGELVEADRTQSKAAFPQQWTNDTPRELGNAWSSWVVPLALALAATLLYRYLFG
ncbi:PREDICTED: cytochrome b5-like [Papilio xuthus]|uniref:Cytochrome b5 n=1 Tax=Papilio xuthus TaxID=66420 RepID=A0A194PVZ8_PAPXU|nr:PREDICTED: cytochrome b5-like [Papilio xuthus]KPI95305.1 Cytochrome b5 [Papilio xuthus]